MYFCIDYRIIVPHGNETLLMFLLLTLHINKCGNYWVTSSTKPLPSLATVAMCVRF